MIKRLIAMTLALQIAMPVSLLAQDTERKPKSETEEILLILSNIKKNNDTVKYIVGGTIGIAATATATYAAYMHKRVNRLSAKVAALEAKNTSALAALEKDLVKAINEISEHIAIGDEATEIFRKEIVDAMNNHAKVIGSNAQGLEALLNEAVEKANTPRKPVGFIQSGSKAGTAATKAGGEVIEEVVEGVVKKARYSQNISARVKNHFVGLQRLGKKGFSNKIVAALVVVGTIVGAVALLNTDKVASGVVSVTRAEFEDILLQTLKDSPESLVFVARDLAAVNARLVASVLNEKPSMKALFKEQANDLLSEETKSLTSKYAFLLTEAEEDSIDKIEGIKDGLFNFDFYNSRYNLKNPIPLN